LADGLESHRARLYHLGARPARRSTLSDANAGRPHEVFADILSLMTTQVHRGLRRKIGETTYLIDSTGLRLTGASEWAHFSAGVCGAKMHVIYDADADCPVYAALSKATVNDITAAQAMPIEARATYVFDLGYYDYRWWANLDAQGCRIVTRFKKNTPLTVTADLAVPEDGHILSDRIGHLPARQAASCRNPFSDPVREVRVRTETGKVLRLLSNDLDAPALKITRFLGTSENAVRIQVAVALIAFLLLRLAQAAQEAVKSPLAFARLVRANLMHRRRIDRLLHSGPPPVSTNAQMTLEWA